MVGSNTSQIRGYRMATRRSRLRWHAAGTAAAVVLSLPTVAAAHAATATSAPSADAVVWAYQRTLLDPQSTSALRTSASPITSSNPLSTAMSTVSLPPSVGGSWSRLTPFPSDFNAIHAITGPNGKILLVAGSGFSETG